MSQDESAPQTSATPTSAPPSSTPPTPAAEGTPEPGAGAREGLPPGAVQVTVRRAPRFLPFILTGVVLGVLLALVAVALRQVPGQEVEVSTRAVLGYLGSIGGLFGGLVGAAVAVAIDRRQGRPSGRSR
ncbi:MAG: hypothetical protein JNL54_22165 [Kineosporiaceae bacterium]|nr:hypothetical protein [Kineosporiaceae bacterium]